MVSALDLLLEVQILRSNFLAASFPPRWGRRQELADAASQVGVQKSPNPEVGFLTIFSQAFQKTKMCIHLRPHVGAGREAWEEAASRRATRDTNIRASWIRMACES